MSKQEIRILEIPEGEPRPLFVKASYVPRLIIGVSAGHLANMRSSGAGPKYYLVGGAVYYRPVDLEAYYGANPIQTTNEPIPVKELKAEGIKNGICKTTTTPVRAKDQGP